MLENMVYHKKEEELIFLLIINPQIITKKCKKFVYRAISEKRNPLDIINEENLSQIDDDSLMVKLVNEVMDENPNVVMQYKEGKEYVVNFFVGGVMKKTKGQANPNKTLEIIKNEIRKR